MATSKAVFAYAMVLIIVGLIMHSSECKPIPGKTGGKGASWRKLASMTKQEKRTNSQAYLGKYGYLDKKYTHTSKAGGVAIPDKQYSTAIKEFQRMAGIKRTGMLDAETMKIMDMPRCGVLDKVEQNRRKRDNTQMKWSKKDFKYKITKFPSPRSLMEHNPPYLLEHTEIAGDIAYAFKMWSDVAPLTFTRVPPKEPADMDISFQYGYHEDHNLFDGYGGELAHAFLPENGTAHFDEDEKWVRFQKEGTNLVYIAAHEIGHLLGLEHVSDKKAVMYPYYSDDMIEGGSKNEWGSSPFREDDESKYYLISIPSFTLAPIDIHEMQQRYGIAPGFKPTLYIPQFGFLD